MTITVITICWNSAGTLRRCMDSLLRQRRLPNEYILVDGGSSDGTLGFRAEEAQAAFAAAGIAFKGWAQKGARAKRAYHRRGIKALPRRLAR